MSRDTVDTLSNHLDITDEDIEIEANRRLKRAIGSDAVLIIGSTAINFTDTTAKAPCRICDSGKRLAHDEFVVCLGCTRASYRLQKIIDKVNAEMAVKQADSRATRMARILAKSRAMKFKRKPRPNTKNAAIFWAAIRGE